MNNSECVKLIESVFGNILIQDGFIKQDKMIWIKHVGRYNHCFESYQVNLGKFGYHFSYGIGCKALPYCSGVRDLCDQKINKYVANLKIDFSKKGERDDDLLMAWCPGAEMSIDKNGINKVSDKIFKYSRNYRGSINGIKDIESTFQSEKGKWHMGLPFYCIVNNVILEYIFSLGLNEEMEKQLCEIYIGDKWKIKALKSIQYLKSAQQVDSAEAATNG